MRLSSKIITLLLLINLGVINTSYADATCKDGSRSESSGSGTCSWHGGVLNWLPEIGRTSSHNQDSYYDRSDNGVDPCKSRGYKESRKECEARVKAARERAWEMIQRSNSNQKFPPGHLLYNNDN